MKLRHISALNLSFAYALAALGVVLCVNLYLKHEALHHAKTLADSILHRNMALHQYMDQVLKPRVFAALEKDGTLPRFDPSWMCSTYLIREVDEIFRPHEGKGYAYREFAVNARNPRNEAEPFEKEFLARVNADPKLRSSAGVQTIDGDPFFTVLMRGETVETPCLRCHGKPEDAPPGLVDGYGADRGFHRRPGDVVSAVSIRVPLAVPYRDAYLFSIHLSAGLLSVLLALYFLQGRITRRLVFRPLEDLQHQFERLAGDPESLGEEIPEPRGEEFASLTRSFNTLASTLRRERDALENTVAARTAELERSNGRLLRDISLRQEVEAELRASRLVLLSLVEASPLPIIACDLDGRIRLWNRAAERIFGWKAEEVVGGPNPFISAGDAGECEELFRRVLGGEVLKGVQITRRRKDGGEVHLRIHSSSIRGAGEEPFAVMSVLEDVSEHQRVYEKLRMAEELLRSVADSAPMLLVALDSQGRITLAKGKILKGIEESSLHGQSLLQRLGRIPLLSETVPSLSEGVQAALDGTPVTGTVEMAGRCYDCSLLPLSDPGGVLGIAFDVTERQAAEERLRESEELYRRISEEFRALLDGIPDSLSLIEEGGTIAWSNRGTAELLSLDKIPRGGFCREVFGCGEQCDRCPVQLAFKNAKTQSGRMTYPDGRTWGVKAFPLRNDSDAPKQVIRWASDISEQIRIQEDAMRAARLASLGELAAGVAHEINNPNGLILLNASLLKDVLRDALPILDEYGDRHGPFALGGLGYQRLRRDLPDILGDTLHAAARIRGIVEDLKNFARQDTTGHADDVDLNAAVEAAVRLVNPVLTKSCDSFAVDLADRLPEIKGSPQRLEQVIVNLLVNACQALAERSKGITVSTRFMAQKREVVLTVRDEGIGIPPEVLPQITNPFFTTRREVGGTGLGLAVSARIVKEHGGQLLFECPPGGGTTVQVILPVSQESPRK